jgi:aspartate carbamoyltransferase catalytic subunit
MVYHGGKMKHIIKSQQFNQEYLETLFKTADSLEKDRGTPMAGKIMASLFYEPSTRTRFSFESAMIRLGGQVITTENAKEFSSVSKGETLEDSIRIISNYADVIILRHSEEGSAKRAASVSHVPVINAGDGPGQHPTQALLDLYTIKRELGKIKGVRIAMVGDLKYGRTIRSLAYLLGKYENIKIFLVSPEELRIGNDIKEYLHKHELSYEEVTDLDKVIGKVDVVYQTRIQKERFPSLEEYEKHKGCYRIDNNTIRKMKEKSIIMHPLPRVDEIATEIDDSPKAVYFKQAYYGLLIRMALLKMVVR